MGQAPLLRNLVIGVGLDEGQMEKYRSDGEVGVQLYVACTALQPTIQKWGYVESR